MNQTAQYLSIKMQQLCYHIKQGVALTGRNTTGPPLAAPDELRCAVEC